MIENYIIQVSSTGFIGEKSYIAEVYETPITNIATAKASYYSYGKTEQQALENLKVKLRS